MRSPADLFRRLFAVALLGVALAGCKSELYSSLPEREANEMISVLSQAGIGVSRERNKGGTFALSVDRDDTARALGVLAQRGLPRQQFESLGNVFDAKKMVSTPFEEKARFMHAINQELANSLTQIAGVVSARVHVMLPDASPLERNRQAPRASVFVYHLQGADLGPHLPVIKSLIVNAVNGLNYEDVAVAMFPTTPPGAIRAGGLASLPGANHLVLILLGAVLVTLLALRQKIGRRLGQLLAKA